MTLPLPTPLPRCPWCGSDPLYVDYHDREWGVPVWDDQALFAKLLLDGAQAGLSWITILRKKPHYERAFEGFDPEKMAAYGPAEVARLLQDPGIVRNRLKVQAFITNARAYLEMRERGQSFSAFIWETVGGEPRLHHFRVLADLPASTPESDALSRRLKAAGFKFVGTTIVYAFMQAVGLVNDHLVTCHRHPEFAGSGSIPPSAGT